MSFVAVTRLRPACLLRYRASSATFSMCSGILRSPGGALGLAREVFAEETPACYSCQIVRGGEFAVFDEGNAQDRFQLRNAARGTNTRT